MYLMKVYFFVWLCTINCAVCIHLIRNKEYTLLKGGNSQMKKTHNFLIDLEALSSDLGQNVIMIE